MSTPGPISPTSRRTAAARWAVGAAAAALLAALVVPALSQSQSQPQAPSAPAAAASGTASAGGRVAPAARPATSTPGKIAKNRAPTSPLWRELNAGQQQSLAPLAGTWDTLSQAQKRKWLALSANYPKLSQPEQQKLHSRMTEWAALSPQQRTLARLNFGETRKISANDKKAKWEAYQALSAEEKHKLAAGAAKPPGTAAAVKPVPRDKLATLPRTRPHTDSKSPRIAASQVDHNTLLPQPVRPAPAALPAPAAMPAPALAVPQPQALPQPQPQPVPNGGPN